MVIVSFLCGLTIGGLVVGIDRESALPERRDDDTTDGQHQGD